MIKVSLVGLGYWGPNLLRNFYNHKDISVVSICDLDEAKVKKYLSIYPKIQYGSTSFEDVLKDQSELVVIATPPELHYEQAKKSLIAGKNILVAKPFTTDSKGAEELIQIANQRGLRIFVDHTFVFHPVVNKIREIIQRGEIGKPVYFDSERIKGIYQKNVDVIWDLAVHDFSILLHLGFEIRIEDVISKTLYGRDRRDMAHISFCGKDGMIGHIYVNWFSPLKIRKILIGGEKGLIFWDDVHPFEKLKIFYYDDSKPQDFENPFFPTYISGDVRIVKVENRETLSIEVENIISSLKGGEKFPSDGIFGLEVVKLLEQCDVLARA
ncbi:MAG: Gfo/Idh/MocA family oxidoreductase [Candidatus Calescibacterium sp.]|nr:Gfo/Idh/MocA family oxidoreductase [Candidatus Calescibacterium sp.]MDW8086672.1 Gfo/Idh/MocA family oxidoreductase [Candidatus Calescibacterium sp.]